MGAGTQGQFWQIFLVDARELKKNERFYSCVDNLFCIFIHLRKMQFLYQYQMYSPVLATLIYWCQTGSVNRIKRRATYQQRLAVNHQPKNI